MYIYIYKLRRSLPNHRKTDRVCRLGNHANRLNSVSNVDSKQLLFANRLKEISAPGRKKPALRGLVAGQKLRSPTCVWPTKPKNKSWGTKFNKRCKKSFQSTSFGVDILIISRGLLTSHRAIEEGRMAKEDFSCKETQHRKRTTKKTSATSRTIVRLSPGYGVCICMCVYEK